MIDEILQRTGLKYEDLNVAERETLNAMMNSLSKTELTIDKVRIYVAKMKEAVEEELTRTDLNTKQDIFLKARLRNYMLLDAYLKTPQEAKKALEAALSGIKLDKR